MSQPDGVRLFNCEHIADSGVAQPSVQAKGIGVASGQAAQVLWREARRVHHPALVDSLGDGQVLLHCPSGDQNSALRTTRQRDGTVLRMDFVHKWGRLICEHIYLHIEGVKQLLKLCGLKLRTE